MTVSTIQTTPTRQDLRNIAVAAAFSVPLALPPAFGYETNPAFLLAPFMAYTVLRCWKDGAAGLFMLSALGGVTSIAIAGYLYPDGRLLTDFLSLLLIMFSAGFYFLGRSLDRDKLLRWTALLSVIFVVVAAANPIVLGQYVRWYIPPQGFAFLNVEFLGLPVFATFGVNALAHLICLQAALICGLAFDRDLRSSQSIACFIGFAACSFLIVGSDSRSSQLFFVILCAAILLYAFRHRATGKTAFLLIVIAILAGAIGTQYAPELRMSGSATSIAKLATDNEDATADDIYAARESMDSPSTDRLALPQAAMTLATGNENPAAAGDNHAAPEPMNSLSTGQVALAQAAVRLATGNEDATADNTHAASESMNSLETGQVALAQAAVSFATDSEDATADDIYAARESMDSLSTGRVALAQAAVREIQESPWIGSGFSPFGRYSRVDEKLYGNSGTHVYYLTALWKGGLLFALPLFLFLALAVASMLRQRSWRDSPQEAFATVAVILMFGLLALTYDTPAVPSAGALAFLLLGALGQGRKQQPNALPC